MDAHDEMSVRKRRTEAVAAARAGAAVASELFGTELTVESKANATDFVTRADREAQDAVVTSLREASDAPIVGEEDAEGLAAAVPETGPAWIVDPIDGTNNFVRGLPIWVTSVAAIRDGEPVAAATVAPVLDDEFVAGDGTERNGEPVTVSDRRDPATFTVAPTLWWDHDRRAEFGTACREIVERFDDLRRLGSAQYALGAVAAGAIEGAITNVAGNPWDTVAGAHMIEQAGGRVTDLHGEPWRHDSTGLVASNGAAHGELLAATQAIEAARDGE